MNNRITLTNKNISAINPDDLIAITIAEGGAMGDPGAIELVDSKLKLYHTHFGEFDGEDLVKIIPFLKTLDIGFGEVDGLPEDWDWLYTGYGNYLFIRPKFKEGVLGHIRKNYRDTGMSEVVELYAHWYEALKSIAEAK